MGQDGVAVDELDAEKGALEHGFDRSFDFNNFASHKHVTLSISGERVNQFIVNVNATRERVAIDKKSKIVC